MAKKKVNLFSIINDLSHEKKRLIDQDPENLGLVKQFMINRAFSFGPDTVLYANEMNKATGISNRMFYDYYFHALRPRKRFNKWIKKTKVDFVEDVMEYFKYNHKRATEALALLSMEDLEKIRKILDTGGKR